MKLPNNCPVDDEIIEEYEDFIERTNKFLNTTDLPDLLCVSLIASKELEDNYGFFLENKQRKFTADLLASYLSECFGLTAVLEKAIINSAYHHARSAVELIVTYNWVFYKEKKIEKKIDRYFAYRELRKFIEYEKSKEPNSTIPEREFSQEQVDEWNRKKVHWAKLFDVDKSELVTINKWHPNTTYKTMLDIFPAKDYLSRGYDYFSHMTHLSPLKNDFGIDAILGIPVKELRSEHVRILVSLTLNSLEVLYTLIEKNTGFDSKVKFPRKKD